MYISYVASLLFLSNAVYGKNLYVLDVGTDILNMDIENQAGESIVVSETILPAGVARKNKFNSKTEAAVSPSVLKSLLHKTGLAFPVSPKEGVRLQQHFIYKTSPYHRDISVSSVKDEFTNEIVPRYGVLQDELVAFVVMNTNEDAYFDHGDSSVPMKEGNMIVFDGATRHRVVVNSGFANVIGPFELTGKQKVAGGANWLPMPAGGGGDPHIIRWDGKRFDFHGECDLVMLSSPGFGNGLGLHVHIRTTIVSSWSYIETIAVKIGDDILEMSAHGKYSINGVQESDLQQQQDISNGKYEHSLGGYSAIFMPPKSEGNPTNFHVIEIDTKDGGSISLKSFRHKPFMNFATTGCLADSVGDAVGLLGTYGVGTMVARNGTTVFNDEHTNEFGKEWQVQGGGVDPSIFHDVRAPQYPTECIMPEAFADSFYYEEDEYNGPEGAANAAAAGGGGESVTNLKKKKRRHRGRRRRLDQIISREDAERACVDWNSEDFENCVKDVIATGDVDLGAIDWAASAPA